MLIVCYTNGGMFHVRMALAQLSFCSVVLSVLLCLLFLHKSHPLTSILLLHQRMLHMPEPNLTMTGRSFPCLCYLLARMSSCKILNLRHGTDGELSHLFIQISSPTSSSPTAGILRAHVDCYDLFHRTHLFIHPHLNLHQSPLQFSLVALFIYNPEIHRLKCSFRLLLLQLPQILPLLLLHNGTTTYQLRTKHCGRLPKTDAR